MPYYNNSAFRELPNAQRSKDLEAVLFTQSKTYNVFVTNPQSYSVSSQANLNAVDIPGSAGDRHVFSSSSSRTIKLSGLTFDTFAIGRSLENVIADIEELMKPVVGLERPEYVGFLWGETKFYPCFLTSFSYDVSLLLGGKPAKISASITLDETFETVGELATTEIENPTNELLETTELTERETSEANQIIESQLRENPGIVGDFGAISRFLDGGFETILEDTGVVKIRDRATEVIKTVGDFDPLDFVFNPFNP